ncbi:MAG: sugar-binding protein [Candidatus Kryptoniota bacterium]
MNTANRNLVMLAKKTPRKIVIDGNLDEWSSAEKVSFDDGVPLLYRRSATVYTLWDNEYLYIAFDVNRRNPHAKVTTHDGDNLWLDDGIEFLIDAKNDGGDLFMPDDIAYHINILNAVYDDRGTGKDEQDISWNGNAIHQVKLKTDSGGEVSGYCCEAAVPWDELGITPIEDSTVIGIDFCVNGTDDLTGKYHYFDWAGLKIFHHPNGFGKLRLVGPDDFFE